MPDQAGKALAWPLFPTQKNLILKKMRNKTYA